MARVSAIARKGDTTGPVVMWVGAILAGIIIFTWYLQHLQPGQLTIAKLDADLERLHEKVSLACGSQELTSIMPMKSDARLAANATALCVTGRIGQANETRCLPAPCAVVDAQFALRGQAVVRKDSAGVRVSAS